MEVLLVQENEFDGVDVNLARYVDRRRYSGNSGRPFGMFKEDIVFLGGR